MWKFKRKRFQEIFPTYEIFKVKVVDKLADNLGYANNDPKRPLFIQEDKMPFKYKMLYSAMVNNGAQNWLANNEETIQVSKMINFTINMSQQLYGSALSTTNDFLEKLTAKNLLSNTTRTYHENPTTNYNQIENEYSELPEQNGKTVGGALNNIKNKSIAREIKKEIAIQEFADIGEAIKNTNFDFKLLVRQILKDNELISMWEMIPFDDNEIDVSGITIDPNWIQILFEDGQITKDSNGKLVISVAAITVDMSEIDKFTLAVDNA